MKQVNYSVMLLLLVHNICLGSAEQEFDNSDYLDFITISLGSKCDPAFFTRKYEIRPCAFPFDWCFTSYGAVYNFINNDFENFFKREYLVPIPSTDLSEYSKKFLKEIGALEVIQDGPEGHNGVMDEVSEMMFIHDFKDNSAATIDAEYELLYTKYMRRIERFYRAMQSGKHIYFLRYLDMNQAEACEFCQLIQYKFPDAQFTLIVIGSDSDQFGADWNIPHIKNFLLKSELRSLWVEGSHLQEELYKKIMSGELKE